MPIAKITGQGLAAIGFSVALLWGSVAADRLMTRQAFTERARVMRQVESLQRRQRPLPVSAPVPHRLHGAPVTAG